MQRELKEFIPVLIVFVLLGASGCSFLKNNFAEESVPPSKELVYDKAQDYTYLVVLDAVTQVPGWELYFTDESTGKIQVYDSRFKEVMNTDDRVVTIWVKPLARNKTTVALDEASRMKLRSHELIDAIEQRMIRMTSQILKPPPPQKPQVSATV